MSAINTLIISDDLHKKISQIYTWLSVARADVSPELLETISVLCWTEIARLIDPNINSSDVKWVWHSMASGQPIYILIDNNVLIQVNSDANVPLADPVPAVSYYHAGGGDTRFVDYDTSNPPAWAADVRPYDTRWDVLEQDDAHQYTVPVADTTFRFVWHNSLVGHLEAHVPELVDGKWRIVKLTITSGSTKVDLPHKWRWYLMTGNYDIDVSVVKQ